MPRQGTNQEHLLPRKLLVHCSSPAAKYYPYIQLRYSSSEGLHYIQKASNHSRCILFSYPDNYMINKIVSARSIKNDKGANDSNYRAYNLVSIRLLFIHHPTPNDCRYYEYAAVCYIYSTKLGGLQSRDYPVDKEDDAPQSA
jgi:hypothetical protein